MEPTDVLFNQYNSILAGLQDNSRSGITTNLLNCGITRNYYDKVGNAVRLLCEFYFCGRYGRR